jgi:hypothetical protein
VPLGSASETLLDLLDSRLQDSNLPLQLGKVALDAPQSTITKEISVDRRLQRSRTRRHVAAGGRLLLVADAAERQPGNATSRGFRP